MKCKIFYIIPILLVICTRVKADLTQDEKDTLLRLHKEAREAVNAPDMSEISWDENIANGAQVR